MDGREWGVKIGGVRRSNLRYADDTTLIASSKDELLEMIDAIKKTSCPRGLLLNVKKTKIMVVDSLREDHTDFILDNEKIEEVEDFNYLGSYITKDGSSRKEIRRRLALARTTTQNLTTIWKSRGISTRLKTRLLRATAFAVASYGSESWAPTKTEQERIDAFEMWAYRRVLRVPWTAMRTNRWILDTIGTELILRKQMAIRKMRFFGHIIRRNGFEKDIIQGAVEGKRKRGRPPTGWFDDIKRWTDMGLSAATRAAADRDLWRRLVVATAALFAPSD